MERSLEHKALGLQSRRNLEQNALGLQSGEKRRAENFEFTEWRVVKSREL